MPLYTNALVPKVEAVLGRALLSGDRVFTDTQFREKATARHTVDSIIKFMEWAAVQVAARVKAAHVSPLQEVRQPSSGAWDLTGVLRLLGNRNYTDTDTTPRVYAKRRTFNDHRDKESKGANATAAKPRYVHERGSHLFRTTSDNPNDARSVFVELPERVVQSGQGYVTGSTGALTISSGVTLGEEHELTIAKVNGVEMGILSVDDTDAATVDYDGDIGSSGSPVTVVVYRPAYHLLPGMFEAALVQFAASLCKAIDGVAAGDESEMGLALDGFFKELERIRIPDFFIEEA